MNTTSASDTGGLLLDAIREGLLPRPAVDELLGIDLQQAGVRIGWSTAPTGASWCTEPVTCAPRRWEVP